MPSVVRVQVEPTVLRWARERSRIPEERLAIRFPKLAAWEAGEEQPTLKQLESFASATHTPAGFLFLRVPPEESVPIPDFRTMARAGVERPSPDLLDTVYICQQRQEWYITYAQSIQEDPVAFVGSASVDDNIVEVAAAMRDTLGFGLAARLQYSSWTGALSGLSERAESAGVLVMVSGVVGSNTHRVLDPEEFRGFALSDPLAPLLFLNGADTKAAQIFTLAHELAHLWIGTTALSNATAEIPGENTVERWCNQVAAELLVPLPAIREQYRGGSDLTEELNRLAALFRVSTLVILRRVHDAGHLTRSQYRDAYEAEMERILALDLDRSGSGGNFYNTLPIRASKRFTRALIASTLGGRTLYQDAFRLLGFKKVSTLTELAKSLGVVA
ncbi:MAG TPA: ImmA/IrrE family metallo-endopeptidase [Candidatus Nitrosotalea sp.]|nr:ImmA/IrrE family metallo-endopeptidase [Candidatus Nitrosotalea sp.]